MKRKKHRTEEEWIKIYKECCNLFGKKGHSGNRVRLTLGQFRDDDNWGFIEIIGFGVTFAEKLIPLCKKYNLEFDFGGHYEVKLREKDEV